jgi:hypothetical protein
VPSSPRDRLHFLDFFSTFQLQSLHSYPPVRLIFTTLSRSGSRVPEVVQLCALVALTQRAVITHDGEALVFLLDRAPALRGARGRFPPV